VGDDLFIGPHIHAGAHDRRGHARSQAADGDNTNTISGTIALGTGALFPTGRIIMMQRVLAVCAAMLAPSFAESMPLGAAWRTADSNDGSWSVEWRIVENGKEVELPTARRRFAIELRITSLRAGGASVRAVTVDAQMPEHHHGMNVQPVFESAANGHARADGMLFHMSGRWEVDVDIDDGETVERAQWDIGMF
jgi:hypothetical protein